MTLAACRSLLLLTLLGLTSLCTGQSGVSFTSTIEMHGSISDPTYKYLSVDALCQKTYVNRWHQNDGSGRQEWTFTPVAGSTPNLYNIQVGGRVGCAENMLSCDNGLVGENTQLGNLVDLYGADDGSGRQQWLLTAVPGKPQVFTIQNVKGRPIPGNNFLSTTYDNVDLWFTAGQWINDYPQGDVLDAEVDLYSVDDGSGRQEWTIPGMPPTNIVITNVVFNLSAAVEQGVSSVSIEAITQANPTNYTQTPLEVDVCSTSEVTEEWSSSNTDAFSTSNTFSASVTVTVTADQEVASESASATFGYSYTSEDSTSRTVNNGKSTTQTNQICTKMYCLAAPMTTMECVGIQNLGSISIPFTATQTTTYIGGSSAVQQISGNLVTTSAFSVTQTFKSTALN